MELYSTGTKVVPGGQAKWFSVEQWRDRKVLLDNGKEVELTRVKRLTQYSKKFTRSQWLALMHAAIEMRASARKSSRRRSAARPSAPALSSNSEDQDESDYELPMSDADN